MKSVDGEKTFGGGETSGEDLKTKYEARGEKALEALLAEEFKKIKEMPASPEKLELLGKLRAKVETRRKEVYEELGIPLVDRKEAEDLARKKHELEAKAKIELEENAKRTMGDSAEGVTGAAGGALGAVAGGLSEGAPEGTSEEVVEGAPERVSEGAPEDEGEDGFDAVAVADEALKKQDEIDDARMRKDAEDVAGELKTAAEENKNLEKTISPEAKDALLKARKNSKFKAFVAGALLLTIGGVTALIAGLTGKGKTEEMHKNLVPKNNNVRSEQVIDGETLSGIKDGYNEKGMFLSPNKAGEFNFGNAKEVAEVCNNNEIKMVEYTARNQSESLADYYANLPDEIKPDMFKGKSILEIEKALESMSDIEYDATMNMFINTMNKATVRQATLNGVYDNAYMRKIDGSTETTHKNMELVKWTSEENGTKVTEFVWTDENGNEIGTMLVKIFYDENGDINGGCLQAIKKSGSFVYNGMEELSLEDVSMDYGYDKTYITPGGRTPETEEKTTVVTYDETDPVEPVNPENPTGHTPKNTNAEYAYAGDHVAPRGVDMNLINTEAEHEAQEYANFTDVAQQAMEDAAKAEEANRVAAEQAAAEQAAVEQATNNPAVVEATPSQIEQADNAENAAASTGAVVQGEANAVTQDVIAEQNQGEQEQNAADTAAAEIGDNVPGAGDDLTGADFANAANGGF